MEFQARVTKLLRAQFKNVLVVEDEVAVESATTARNNALRQKAIDAHPTGEGTKPAPTRADQFAFPKKPLEDWQKAVKSDPKAQTPPAQAFSNKSRLPSEYPSEAAFLDQVSADAVELAEKYSGDVTMRSPTKFGKQMAGKAVEVSKSTLIYDKTAGINATLETPENGQSRRRTQLSDLKYGGD